MQDKKTEKLSDEAYRLGKKMYEGIRSRLCIYEYPLDPFMRPYTFSIEGCMALEGEAVQGEVVRELIEKGFLSEVTTVVHNARVSVWMLNGLGKACYRFWLGGKLTGIGEPSTRTKRR